MVPRKPAPDYPGWELAFGRDHAQTGREAADHVSRKTAHLVHRATGALGLIDACVDAFGDACVDACVDAFGDGCVGACVDAFGDAFASGFVGVFAGLDNLASSC